MRFKTYSRIWHTNRIFKVCHEHRSEKYSSATTKAKQFHFLNIIIINSQHHNSHNNKSAQFVSASYKTNKLSKYCDVTIYITPVALING